VGEVHFGLNSIYAVSKAQDLLQMVGPEHGQVTSLAANFVELFFPEIG
jgi:hypothetical protein